MGRGRALARPRPTTTTYQHSQQRRHSSSNERRTETHSSNAPAPRPKPRPRRQPNRPHNSIQRLSNPRHDNARDRSPSTTPHPRNTRTDRQTPDPNRLASSGTPPSTKDTTCFHSSFFIPTREKRRMETQPS